MPPHRDVAAFEQRAARYEQGWLGRLHHQIARQTAELALALSANPQRVLDIGCGTGYLLRLLARQYPRACELAGIDPASAMIEAAVAAADDERLRFAVGAAEQLPYPAGSFDLVVSTTSFDHWSDQQAGLRECARVLTPAGHLVLVDFVLQLAQAHADRRPPREGANAEKSLPAAHRCGLHLDRLARPLPSHQSRDGIDLTLSLERRAANLHGSGFPVRVWGGSGAGRQVMRASAHRDSHDIHRGFLGIAGS